MKHILAVLAVSLAVPASTFGASQDRSYTGGRFSLDLNGGFAGFLKSVDGGGIEADVITENTGGTIPRKHLSNLIFPEFELQVDPTTGAALEPWIDATLKGSIVHRDGEIHSTGSGLLNQDFFFALITEVGIPACDASSKDVAYMNVKFVPEFIRYKKGGVIAPIDSQKKQKMFLPGNFRLEIAGLDCTKVNKVDGFTIKQNVAIDDTGETRDPQRKPGALEFPNLTITLAESSSASWFEWFEKFVIQGNNFDSEEKSGRLVFLSPDLKEEVLEVKLFNLGIFKLVPENSESNSDNIKRVKVELYCEQMELNFKPGQFE